MIRRVVVVLALASCSAPSADQTTPGGIDVWSSSTTESLDSSELERLDDQWADTAACLGYALGREVYVHSPCDVFVDPWGRRVRGYLARGGVPHVTRSLAAYSHELSHTRWPYHTTLERRSDGVWVVGGPSELGPYATSLEASAALGPDRICGDAVDSVWRSAPTVCVLQ